MDERHVELVLDGDKVVAVKPAPSPTPPDNKKADDEKAAEKTDPRPV